jgi:hypothetical protein
MSIETGDKNQEPGRQVKSKMEKVKSSGDKNQEKLDMRFEY